MMAFARFKNENWCMDLAYVDQVAKEIKDLKYLLIRQDVFDRTVDAKGMKTKDSKETVRAFLTVITNDIDPRKFESRRQQKLLESLKNYAKHRAYIFILHWVRPRLHLLNVQYDPWKSYFTVTWKIMDTSSFEIMFQFVTTVTSRRNCSVDLIPKNVKTSDFLSILRSRPLREIRKPKSKIGNRNRISK